MSDFDQRFGGIGRLVTPHGLEKLRRARVCVIGIGGVGCWAVEALARSAVGEITMVDLDDVCVSNVNRQLHAIDGHIGQPKVSAMAERIRRINPECVIREDQRFYTESTSDSILDHGYDYVIDAFDAGKKKAILIAKCTEKKIPVITVGGAGGRLDPTAIRTTDLARSLNDPLLHLVRKMLRTRHGFPRGTHRNLNIQAVWSEERPSYLWSDGTMRDQREIKGSDMRLNCDSGFGTATFVVGAFGFAAAAAVVRGIVKA
jgi:tRNA A37 threonylcarbamoyladenosine dehydratase